MNVGGGPGRVADRATLRRDPRRLRSSPRREPCWSSVRSKPQLRETDEDSILAGRLQEDWRAEIQITYPFGPPASGAPEGGSSVRHLKKTQSLVHHPH